MAEDAPLDAKAMEVVSALLSTAPSTKMIPLEGLAERHEISQAEAKEYVRRTGALIQCVDRYIQQKTEVYITSHPKIDEPLLIVEDAMGDETPMPIRAESRPKPQTPGQKASVGAANTHTPQLQLQSFPFKLQT